MVQNGCLLVTFFRPVIGTGPRRDRTTQSVYGSYAYFDTSEPRKKGDLGVFSTTPFRLNQGPDERYCVQFYCVLYGDAFGDLETFVQLEL